MTAATLLLALIPWIGICADLHGTLNVTDVSQASVRPAFTEDRQAVDLETLPIADVTLEWPKSRLSFGYGPRFLRSDAFGDERSTLVLHVGRASYSYGNQRHTFTLAWTSTFGRGTASTVALVPPPIAGAASADTGLPPPTFTLHSALIAYTYTKGRSRYSLTQTGTLGRQSLAALALAASPGTTPMPTVGTLPVGSTPGAIGVSSAQAVTSASEVTTGVYSHAWTRRWQSTLSASYGISGGLHQSDQVALPQQRTATGAVAAGHAYTRQDTLISMLSVTHTDVERGLASNGLEHWILLAGEAWNRVWSRDVNSSILLGVAVTSTLESNGTRIYDAGPSLSASVVDILLRRREYTVTFLASAGLAPGINPLTGQLQTRATGTSTLQLTAHHSLLAASVDATQTLPASGPSEARLVAASLLASHNFGPIVALAARYRLIWQDIQASAAPPAQTIGISRPVIWIAALLLTVRAPPVGF